MPWRSIVVSPCSTAKAEVAIATAGWRNSQNPTSTQQQQQMNMRVSTELYNLRAVVTIPVNPLMVVVDCRKEMKRHRKHSFFGME